MDGSNRKGRFLALMLGAGAAVAMFRASGQEGRSLLVSLFVSASQALDRTVGWPNLPKLIGALVLVGNRTLLRERNLYDTSSSLSTPAPEPSVEGTRHLTARSADGSNNDLSHPTMGRADTRFGRNVPIQYTYQDPAMMEPNPRVVSRELLTRDTFLPATTLNVIAGAWLQFMIKDWLSHGKSPKENPWQVPLADDDPWPEHPMTILRTREDPTRPPGSDNAPPTYANTQTHWWDASQLYGANLEAQKRVRSGEGGKLTLSPEGSIPRAMLEQLGNEPGWWVGLALLFTLFAREHNAICDRLRADYPSWSDDDLFDHARLVNAALLAKIHTVEWTPGIISHPTTRFAMRGNWWGLAGERLYRTLGRLSESEVVSGIPGSPTNHHTAPYAITEEFVAVYRMHPLLPDDYSFHSAIDGSPIEEQTFLEIAGKQALGVLDRVPLRDLLYSFGIAHPGQVTLHNFPRSLQNFTRPDGFLMDLAAVDILRSRELGVPRYNQFRRLFHLEPASSFEELTDNPEWAEQLRRVYNDDIESLDLMVGVYAEKLPPGFGFSDTAFRVFVLMASRRLKSDRFFTKDYTPQVYTQTGLDWIDNNNMSSVLLRHFPDLAPALRNTTNAFAPWSKVS